jgi:RND family efflux transporter MFP subunit
VPPLLVLVGLLAAWYGWHRFAESHINPHVDAEAEDGAGTPMQVVLSDALIAAGDVVVEAVEPRTEQVHVVVPGRLAYDDTQRVSVRLGTSGLVTKVNVQPGDEVEVGQVLATMSSPELGTARADEIQRAEELKLAQRQADWDRRRASGIHKLIDAIRAAQAPAQIREEFTQEELGLAREKLLSAYSDQLLAQSMLARIEGAQQTGALPARTIEERKRNFENAGATLQGLIEQTTFDADRAAQASQIALDDARRRWQIAAGRVSTLLGLTNTLSQRPAGPASGATAGAAGGANGGTTIDDLSAIEVRAPKRGTIEQKLYNENERVEAGAVLFVLADTSELWLKADLREPQWTALSLKAGQEIAATSPALPDETLKATVVRTGREVDPSTNAIPLVAKVRNAYGRLRPGLYVQVELPLGEVTTQIVIPESAVATHAGDTFVFVTNDDHVFVRRDVRVGKSQDGWTEIIAGLAAGERIATRGVFVLKSELLLENEE